ncbi:hypothetical protein I7I53_00681 [Histoplasma capsulatum var. duboisii H88]|nr:hypothetical protein I7I53_00681 [Histoplasma capsulatum var. duboisii H88]
MPRMQIHHGQGERVDPPPDNVAGYPRQVDISPQVRRSIEQHQREDLRVPKPFEEPATASDIQNLIAAIGKLEKRDRAQFDTKELEPLSSPTRVPGRLTKLLDSLAGLLVSNANHEVIATALCVDATAKKITIKISSNTTVTTATYEHAKWIWTALSDISSRYHELHPASSEEPTPTHKIKNKEVQNLVFNFRIRCLRFNFAKIQKRINGKFLLFKKLDLTEFDKDHPLQTFSKAIIGLEEYFTRTQGAIYGKPDENNTEAWKLLNGLFRKCQECVKYIFRDDGLTPDERLRLSSFDHWEPYFRKVAIAMNEVDDILKVSWSPQCRHLFHYRFDIHTVPATLSKTDTVPQNAKDWEDVLERALSLRNKLHKETQTRHTAEKKLLKISTVTQDTAYMCREQISKKLVTHCEIKLLLLIAASESENPSLAKAYSYLGVSKLSCHGCHLFIEAYNRIHGTRFMTRGTHGKSYRPWQFPRNFPKHAATAQQMYSMLVDIWGSYYNGYEIEMKNLGQHSSAGSYADGPATFESDSPKTRAALAKILGS